MKHTALTVKMGKAELASAHTDPIVCGLTAGISLCYHQRLNIIDDQSVIPTLSSPNAAADDFDDEPKCVVGGSGPEVAAATKTKTTSTTIRAVTDAIVLQQVKFDFTASLSTPPTIMENKKMTTHNNNNNNNGTTAINPPKHSQLSGGPALNFEHIHFSFKAYFPAVFAVVRNSCQITDQLYHESFATIDKMVRYGQLANSGSSFYYSPCNRWIIKTIPYGQVRFFLSLLPSYADYLAAESESKILRILGVYRIKWRAAGGLRRLLPRQRCIYVMVTLNTLYHPLSPRTGGPVPPTTSNTNGGGESTTDLMIATPASAAIPVQSNNNDNSAVIILDDPFNDAAMAALNSNNNIHSNSLSNVGGSGGNVVTMTVNTMRSRRSQKKAISESLLNLRTKGIAVYDLKAAGLRHPQDTRDMRRIKAEQLTLAIDGEERDRLLAQCERDVQFLITSGVNDYSLLLGVYELPTPVHSRPLSGAANANDNNNNVNGDINRHNMNNNSNGSANAAQRFFHAQLSTDRQALYYLGLIDILSKWNWPRRVGFFLMPGVYWYYPRYTPPSSYGKRVIQSIKSLFQQQKKRDGPTMTPADVGHNATV